MKCFECGTETKDLTGSFLNGIGQLLCRACSDRQKTHYDPVCDFCSGRPVEWRYPARSFPVPEVPIQIGQRTFIAAPQSVADWAACTPCHDCIEAGNDAALVVRAVAGCQMPDALMYMPRLFEAFRAHRTGPAVRESGWKSGWGANESQTRKE